MKRPIVISVLALTIASLALGQSRGNRSDESKNIEQAIRQIDNERIQVQLRAEKAIIDSIYADGFIGTKTTSIARSQGPTATKYTITFKTTSDNKDWNTQVRDRIVCDNVDVARLFCCSADRRKDQWDDGSTESRDMQILQAVDKTKVPDCTFVLGSRASGNDKWQFVPSLRVQYSDGTSEDRTYDGATLDSRGGGLVEKRHRIKDSH